MNTTQRLTMFLMIFTIGFLLLDNHRIHRELNSLVNSQLIGIKVEDSLADMVQDLQDSRDTMLRDQADLNDRVVDLENDDVCNTLSLWLLLHPHLHSVQPKNHNAQTL